MKPKEQDEAEIKKRLGAGDGSHWYNQKAEPCHEIENKSKPGEWRAVTKSDAKKLNLLPSVTNIMGRCDSKPGLDDWKRNQIFDAIRKPEVLERMLACHGDDVQFNAICKEIDEEAREKSKAAADLGSKFHHLAELMTEVVQPGALILMDKTGMTPQQVAASCRMFEASIVKDLREHMILGGVTLMNERSIVWNELVGGIEYGVGGRLDLIATVTANVARSLTSLHQILSSCPENAALIHDRINRGLDTNILIDWKTRKPYRGKKTPEIPSFPIYPSDPGQLAAYGNGVKRALALPIHLCISLVVPSDFIAAEEGVIVPFSKPVHRVFSPAIIDAGLKYFHSCIQHWQHEETIAGSDFAPVVIED